MSHLPMYRVCLWRFPIMYIIKTNTAQFSEISCTTIVHWKCFGKQGGSASCFYPYFVSTPLAFSPGPPPAVYPRLSPDVHGDNQ